MIRFGEAVDPEAFDRLAEAASFAPALAAAFEAGRASPDRACVDNLEACGEFLAWYEARLEAALQPLQRRGFRAADPPRPFEEVAVELRRPGALGCERSRAAFAELFKLARSDLRHVVEQSTDLLDRVKLAHATGASIDLGPPFPPPSPSPGAFIAAMRLLAELGRGRRSEALMIN